MYHPDPEIHRALEIINSTLADPEEFRRLISPTPEEFDGRPAFSDIHRKLAAEGYALTGTTRASGATVVITLELPSGSTADVPLELG